MNYRLFCHWQNLIIHMKKIICFFALLLLLTVFLPEFAESQCAMCKAAVENHQHDETSFIGSGLNKGILYLMVVPYILITIIGYAWYKHSKKRQPAD